MDGLITHKFDSQRLKNFKFLITALNSSLGSAGACGDKFHNAISQWVIKCFCLIWIYCKMISPGGCEFSPCENTCSILDLNPSPLQDHLLRNLSVFYYYLPFPHGEAVPWFCSCLSFSWGNFLVLHNLFTWVTVTACISNTELLSFSESYQQWFQVMFSSW